MYQHWLEYAGVEIINVARTKKYVEALLPGMRVDCETAGLLSARGHSSYVSPAADNAPWYRAGRPATGRFYGLFPNRISGAEDSSRTVGIIEETGDGATHTRPRYASREMQVTATAFAADEEAMGEGLAWLRKTLAAGDCEAGGCSDNDMRMYLARPAGGAADNHMLRTFIRVEVLDNLRVVKDLSSKRAVAREVTFIFSLGKPWAFTPKVLSGSVVPSDGTSFTDPAGEDCYATNNAYADFVNDPYYTAIALPPQPPVVRPPNIIPVSSWRRKTLAVTQVEVDRWGRVMPVVTVSAGAGGATQLRLRFYGGGVTSGCGFEGEFLIGYIPPNASLVIDAMRQSITVVKANGSKVPGGHLVYGSGGLPMKWPALGCKSSYILAADLLPGQTGITVVLETAVRE